MSAFMLAIFVLKFLIPGLFSVLFRAYGLGYKSKKSLAAGLTIYIVYTVGLSALLIVVMGYGQFTHLSPAVMALGSLSVLIFSTDHAGKTIFLQMTQGCITTAVSVVINLIRTVFALSYPTLVAILAVVFPLLYWFALRYWAKPLRFMADHIHAELPALVVMPILSTVVVSLLPVYPAQSFSNHPLFITAMMLTVELIYFLFIYTFYRNLLKISRLLKDEARAQLLESEILSYQESLESARQMRHDLRHHNALLLDFLEAGDTAGAMDYLHANGRALAASKPVQFTANPTANAVLRVYSRQAQAAGIFFSVNAVFPESLPLSAPELGALLSNLLENAVEACRNVESSNRQISVSAQAGETGWKLEVRNSVSGTTAFEEGMPISFKPGGGTGTKSVAHIVNLYGGMLRFKQEDAEFFAQIVLPIPG